MIRSMTGFGHFESTSGGKTVICEIKSVNHRYYDLNLHMPRKLSAFENNVRARLREEISRGKVDVAFSYESTADGNVQIQYNPQIASEYLKSINAMSEEFGLKNDVTVMSIASLPDVFEVMEADDNEEEMLQLTMDALNGALAAFIKNRTDEGERLKTDLLEKLGEMKSLVREIEIRSPQIIEEYKENLRAKIADLLEDTEIDESRLAMEVTIFADKICVDEEMVRLNSHIKEAQDTLNGSDQVGRKMDFLAQELNRESNTILSKSTDVTIADIGIKLKTLIEKIREQIQNLE